MRVVNIFIEFNNIRTGGQKLSVDVTEIKAFAEDISVDGPSCVLLYMKDSSNFAVDETYRSVKTKINNALKRIARGAQGDSESEIETT